ncbi:MAG TPA: 2-succinyl-5-enolpyruvyl-6-hydroxy-3-cyclohexene-1-carboxylic-acid synthase [Acidimicrobiales bacterium]|jgi:2-succinyl-5-enolpyruvyl-6-hydroxy-3-cyclohexene-1-carboxylate synthase
MSVNVQSTFCATLVDEWALSGVVHAVICPGSRSTPLAIELARRLQVHVRLDERSAGFYALGLAMVTAEPTIVCTTSGTAAPELHAAVVEAHHAHVPLIVCTADRPPELQGVGASQTIDQIGLFTTSTRWAAAPGVPEEHLAPTWRPLARRALAESLYGPQGPGPVHLNLAFRIPLAGDRGQLPERGQAPPPAASIPPLTVSTQNSALGNGSVTRGLIVAGANATRDPARLLELATSLGWPVLADPRSGARLPGTIAAADAIVQADIELPDIVVRLGSTPWISAQLDAYLTKAAAKGARIISVDRWFQHIDANHVVTEFHHADPDAWLEAAVAAATAKAAPPDQSWLNLWHNYEARGQSAIEETLLQHPISEPHAIRTVAQFAADTDASLFTSASMPIRDLESFAPAHPTPPLAYSNRGANGIDGIVSTALGIAATGQRTIAVLGDLAFLHDVSGLVNLPDVPCTFVVLDNGGGGIFSFLPQAGQLDAEIFELLFGTPPTSDIGAVAQGFGLKVSEVDTAADLRTALADRAESPQPSVIRVRVPNRTDNVALHQAITQAVRLALAEPH